MAGAIVPLGSSPRMAASAEVVACAFTLYVSGTIIKTFGSCGEASTSGDRFVDCAVDKMKGVGGRAIGTGEFVAAGMADRSDFGRLAIAVDGVNVEVLVGAVACGVKARVEFWLIDGERDNSGCENSAGICDGRVKSGF